MAGELGQQTVDFSSVVRRATEETFLSLEMLVERSRNAAGDEQSDSEKKIDLLKYIVKARQRMLRLHVLAKWCNQVPLVQYCQQLAATLSSHDTCFTQTADSLFYMHEGLQQARAPIFDVPSAIEVLLAGNYQRLPKCIEDLGMHTALTEEKQKPVLKTLNTLLRAKLLDVSLPKEISDITIFNGYVVIRVDGEFKVMLSLGYRGHLSLWRILHLELLVGEKNGHVKLEESRRFVLGDDLERRMAAAENPLMLLYSILHDLCVVLVMDTVIRQVHVLRQGRWKDAIRFELISESSTGQAAASLLQSQEGEIDSTALKTPGLKIVYWLDHDKNSGGAESSLSSFVKIEPGQDLRIKCLHSSFILDPHTNKEAEFVLNQSCIDVEELLLRVISCNRHTRLLEIQRELNKNVQLCQAHDDVVLKRNEMVAPLQKEDVNLCLEDYCGDEVLQVRAYGKFFVTLGVNIRNGRFLLKSSKNLLAPSSITECEEALNQRSMSPTDVFINLRSKSILCLFGTIGRFVGLKVHEQSSEAFKIPKFMLHGSNMLLMGFPRCGDTYFLIMELDKDFKPLCSLLEAQIDSSANFNSVNEVNNVVRRIKIDINQIQISEDDKNLSLIDLDKFQHFLPTIGDCIRTSEHALLSKFGLEPAPEIGVRLQSGFSALVDEVFDFEKHGSGSFFPVQNHISSSLNVTDVSQFSSRLVNSLGLKTSVSSPKWDVGISHTQNNNTTKCSPGFPSSGSSSYQPSSAKGLIHCSPNPLPSSSPSRNSSVQNLATSKSEQDLNSLKSARHGDIGSCSAITEKSEIQSNLVNLANENSKDAINMINATRPTRLLSPLRGSGFQVATPVQVSGVRASGFKNSSPGHSLVLAKNLNASPARVFSSSCQTPESVLHISGSDMIPKQEKTSKKRSLTDLLALSPSFERFEFASKRRKLELSGGYPTASHPFSSVSTNKPEGYTYGSLLAEANHGRAPSNIYVSALLQIVRQCSLCIIHAQLTSQMDALEIPYTVEIGSRIPSSNLWFRLPFVKDDSWKNICLRLGKPGRMSLDVKINDSYFRELWELRKGSTSTIWGSGVRITNASDIDTHIHYDSEGVFLSYNTLEADSIQKLVLDLKRLYSARFFACSMHKLLDAKADDKIDDGNMNPESLFLLKGTTEVVSEQVKRSFKIEAVGLMSLWLTYGIMPVTANFAIEWEAGKEGCTIHVSPDQLWPHTKYLEDFINGGEVASFLHCICLTAGPLLSLGHAIRPARMPGPVTTGPSPLIKQNIVVSQGLPTTPSNAAQPASSGPMGTSGIAPLGIQCLHNSAMLNTVGRGGPGIVPSSLLPIDVSVVLRGPYWIRIIYRKKFSVDMRCFAGDQVWLQPATPPKGGPAAGGSLPCPQFRPFIMEHVAQGLNALEPNFTGGGHNSGLLNSNNTNQNPGNTPMPQNGSRLNITNTGISSRPNLISGSQFSGPLSRVGNAMLPSTGLHGVPLRLSSGANVPGHMRGDLNTAFIGLGDDGGYGGGWVPLAALKKVLRGILKYLGVLWLFAQLPEILKDVLGSLLKDNEGALLNLDQEQPALRFFVGGYVYAVSVHRVQLLLQVLSVKRFHNQQPQQQQQQQQPHTNTQEELAQSEIAEISEYFCRRVASEPYDASRVASFVTLLTLPIYALREFLKLIAWKKGLSQAHAGDIAPNQRARIELCLENHSGSGLVNSEIASGIKSNIVHDRANSTVDFSLAFVLDPQHIPHVNAAGGAAWLPYCVSVRLQYSFGENPNVSLLGMEGSHGGHACWLRLDDWEKCKQRVIRIVAAGGVGDITQGRVRLVADNLQRTLQASLQQLKESSLSANSAG